MDSLSQLRVILDTTTTAATYAQFVPSDYGSAGKYALSFDKSTTANIWTASVKDSTGAKGVLNIDAELQVNGTSIAPISVATLMKYSGMF